ncbi:MAG: FtsX-like permease family protein [Corynebacterium sp.]|nr:FtsX-like permease family protein [Corynebacterium sp.]
MMRTISLRNIAAHKLRLALSIFAVVLGTAFISGSAMFTNVLSDTYNKAASSQFENIDLVATGKSSGGILSLIGGAGGSTATGTISESSIASLRMNDEVAQVVVANDRSSIILAGTDGKAIRGGSVGSAYVEGHPSLDKAPLVEGSWPTEAGTIAIDQTTAENGNLGIGTSTTMVTENGTENVTIVGIFNAKKANINGVAVVMPESDYFTYIAPRGVATALVTLKDGVTEEQGANDLAVAFPQMAFTKTSYIVEQTASAMADALKYVKYALWAFAGIGLLVGTFIISNTFSMIVAQRNREFALLRSIGISTSQVTRSVLFEAIVVGFIGSVLGILAGLGLSQGIFAVLAARGMEIKGGVGLDTTSVLVPLLVGVIITAISAYAPARAAGRIRPVEALNANPAKGVKLRSWIGAPILILGILFAIAGATRNSDQYQASFVLVGLAGVFLVIGYWLAGPAISIPIAAGIGRVIGAPFKTLGRLAATNSRRNPRRTAATAFALTLGVMLVSGVGMLGNTMSKTLSDQLQSSINADYMVSSASTAFNIPSTVPDDLRKVDGVSNVTAVGLAPVTVAGEYLYSYSSTNSIVADGDLTKSNKIDVISGDASASGVILETSFAQSHNLKLGDEVSVGGNGATTVTHVVALVQADYMSGLGDGWITKDVVDQLGSAVSVTLTNVYVNAASGANMSTVQDRIEDAVSNYLVLQVQSKNELTGLVGQVFNTMLAVIYALLGLSIIIAVLGIINTLALSVVERTREIGMLRAVGMQRKQVRLTIYLESIVIALYGAIMGAVMGLGLGWCFTRPFSGELTVYVPWDQVALMIVASAVVGIIAAVLPGIRASRTNPLEAIHE